MPITQNPPFSTIKICLQHPFCFEFLMKAAAKQQLLRAKSHLSRHSFDDDHEQQEFHSFFGAKVIMTL